MTRFQRRELTALEAPKASHLFEDLCAEILKSFVLDDVADFNRITTDFAVLDIGLPTN